MLTGYIYKNAHLAQTYSNVSSLEVFNILYTFLMFPLFFSVSMYSSFQCSFFHRWFQVVKKILKGYTVTSASPFPPSPIPLRGWIPVTSFSYIPPERFSWSGVRT